MTISRPRRREDGTREVKGLFRCFRCGKTKPVEANIDKLMAQCWQCKRGWHFSAFEVPSIAYTTTPTPYKPWTPKRGFKKLPPFAHAEIRRRGLDPEWVEERYRVRWDGSRMCWPAGEGWSRRAVFPWETPKTLTVSPRGFIGQHLLEGPGLHVVITEGDYKAAAIPLPFIGLGLMGTGITSYQVDLLRRARPASVTLLRDGGVLAAVPRSLQDCQLNGLPDGQGPDDIPRHRLVRMLLDPAGSVLGPRRTGNLGQQNGEHDDE